MQRANNFSVIKTVAKDVSRIYKTQTYKHIRSWYSTLVKQATILQTLKPQIERKPTNTV